MERRERYRGVLALLATGLSAFVVWVAWIDPVAPATGTAASIASLPGREVVPASVASAGLRSEGAERDVDGQPSDPLGRAALGSQDLSYGAPLGSNQAVARFRVTSGLSNRPLAGVQVHAGGGHLVGQSSNRGLPAAEEFQRDPVPRAIERLPVFESDGEGIVEVPLEGSAGVVAAVSIPASGGSPALEAWVHPTADQIRKRQGEPFPLKLHERQVWTFRAIDDSGRGRPGVEVKAQFLGPADLHAISEGGVPIAFPFPVPTGNPSTRSLGTTGEDGVLTYARAPLLPPVGTGQARSVALLLAAQVPTAEQIPVLVDELPPPGAVIELPMPPASDVTAQLLDHDGRPLSGWHELNVLLRSTAGFAPIKSALALNGAATLGGLPAVKSLRVQVGPGSGPAVDVAGLRRSGSHSHAEIRAGARHAVLHGRILDTSGHALADRRIEGQGGGWDATCAGTDPEGRFSVLVPLELDQGLPQTIVFQADPKPGGGGLEPTSEYRVRLDAPLEAATYALGDLAPSSPRPLLAAGQVTTGSDRRHDGYVLQVQFRAPDATWRELHGLRAWYAPSGQFTLHGDPEPQTDHRLLVRTRGRRLTNPEPIAFTPGAEDLHIDLGAGNSLKVRVATPLAAGSGRLLSSVLDFVLEGVEGPGRDLASEQLAVGRFGNVDIDGLTQLRWNGLQPGFYSLRVLAKGTDSSLAELPQIGVSEGETLAPGMLDLTGALYPFQLDLVGPDGVPIRDAQARLQWGAESDEAATTLRGAHCAGIAPNIPVQLTIQAKGYVTDSRPLAPGSQQIVLQPTSQASLQVRVTGLDLPDGVHADLIWGPASLPRSAGEASGFAMHEDTQRAVNEQRTGRQALAQANDVEFEQPVHPGPTGGLRLILALSALPPPHQPDAPTRILLDEMPGWVLSNPQPATATLAVDGAALYEALAALGRP